MIFNIRQSLTWGRALLQDLPASDARRESEILLKFSLQCPLSTLYTNPEQELSAEQFDQFKQFIEKRAQGMPIAYLLGYRDFWTLSIPVNEHCLIPRSDSEELVSLALAHLDAKAQLSLLELGTGSGAIALALAHERPHWQISACDKSPAALTLAKSSAEQLGLHSISWHLSDWFQAFKGQLFDAILSNPPYLSDQDPHLNQGDLRFEPKSALVSGHSGLEALDWIIQNAQSYLKDHGLLLLEHGWDQGASVRELLHNYGYQSVQSWPDLQGHERISGGISA